MAPVSIECFRCSTSWRYSGVPDNGLRRRVVNCVLYRYSTQETLFWQERRCDAATVATLRVTGTRARLLRGSPSQAIEKDGLPAVARQSRRGAPSRLRRYGGQPPPA